MSGVERAVSAFEEGFSCSQALLSAFAPQFGLDRESALKVSGAFGAGMGRMGETCGAVTGALMAIGLRHGRIRADDTQTKELVYRLVGEFVAAFRQRHGSILCRELLRCDLSTNEGQERAQREDLFALCPTFVRDAAEIVEQMLLERRGFS